ncbi:hypothetical protein ACFX2I_020218 [Malus domestica]
MPSCPRNIKLPLNPALLLLLLSEKPLISSTRSRPDCYAESLDDDDDDVYESFINIMASYRMISSNNNREATEVIYRKVAALFKDHPDLLQEFTRLLPPLRQEYHSYLEVTTTVKDKDRSHSSNCTPSYCLLPKNYSYIIVINTL